MHFAISLSLLSLLYHLTHPYILYLFTINIYTTIYWIFSRLTSSVSAPLWPFHLPLNHFSVYKSHLNHMLCWEKWSGGSQTWLHIRIAGGLFKKKSIPGQLNQNLWEWSIDIRKVFKKSVTFKVSQVILEYRKLRITHLNNIRLLICKTLPIHWVSSDGWLLQWQKTGMHWQVLLGLQSV